MRKIMGLLVLYQRSIQNFSKIAKPLYDLLKLQQETGSGSLGSKRNTGKGYNINDHQLLPYNGHKNMLIRCIPILAYPRYNQQFIVHTGPSQVGLGPVLYQKQSDVVRVIAYASRTLNPAEKNYIPFPLGKW